MLSAVGKSWLGLPSIAGSLPPRHQGLLRHHAGYFDRHLMRAHVIRFLI